MELRPYQRDACNAIVKELSKDDIRSTLIVLPTGCHDPNQGILLANGEIKVAKDIVVGDRLIGPDGKPRNILNLIKGTGMMYRITPAKGDPFIVDENHILSLVRTPTNKNPKYPSEAKGGEICNVSVKEYLTWSKYKKHIHKLYRSDKILNFNESKETTIDPYFLGVLLGDGGLHNSLSITTPDKEIVDEIERQCDRYGYTTRSEPAGKAKTYIFRSGVLGAKGGTLHQELKTLGLRGATSGTKFVPHAYKTAPIGKRLELLAGLMDTDGFCNGTAFDYISKSKQLAEDIAFICRSVGLAAYVSRSIKRIKSLGFEGEYWRVQISGDCSIIPTRIKRKQAAARKQIKDVKRTGFTIEPIGKGEYCGFTVDADNLYLMDDFTVTHNCGKTVVFCGVARYFAFSTAGGRHPCRVLVMAHQNLLLKQAAEKFNGILDIEVNVEKGKKTCKESSQPITVATVQTMARRLCNFDTDYFGLIIIDESHHVMSSTYQNVLQHFSKAKVLGVTATPDRADGKKLNKFFQSVAFSYTIKQAQEDGYLAPLDIKRAAIYIDLNKVKKHHGDFDDRSLGSVIEPHLHKIAEEVRRLGKDRKIVCFVPLIRTAKKAAEIFSHYGFRSAWTSGDDKEKDRKLEAFDRGDYDIIFSSMLLTEGWDCPSVDCVIILRPTTSRALYVQMLGRGLRLSPEKKECLLIDFLFQHDSFDLATPEDVIDQEKPKGKGVAPGPGGVADREESLAKKLEKAAIKQAEEEARKLRYMKDPFADPELSQVLRERYKPSELRDEPITKKQKKELEEKNVNWSQLTYTQAQILLDYYKEKRKPSEAMVWRLKKLGYTSEEVLAMNFIQANKILRQAKATGRW